MEKNMFKFTEKARVLVVIVIAGLAILLASCKGPAGPQGVAGSPGAPGTEFSASFQQGVWPDPSYTGTSDSFIVDALANTNYGACQSVYVGVDNSVNSVYRGVFRFDVTSIIPQNVQVTNAYMTLYPSTSSGQVTITAYPLTRYFSEGSGTCAGVDNTIFQDLVTWTKVWITPGGDFGSAPVSNTVYYDSNTGGFYPQVFNLDNATVQNWIANPVANYGVILKAANENTGTNYMGFISRNDAIFAVTNRPKLTVYYKLP